MRLSTIHPGPVSTNGPLTITTTVEPVLLVSSAFFALAANRPFFAAALRGHEAGSPATWGFLLGVSVLLVALHFVLLALVCNRWTLKPVLAMLIVISALASYFTARYSVYFDATMVRNVLHTHPAEARELLSPALLPHLALYAAAPLVLLWRVRIERTAPLRAGLIRAAWLLAALAVGVAALLAVFQPFASLMRNHREVRYLITPGNVVASLVRVLGRETRAAAAPRQPIGLDAKPGTALRRKPLVVVLVVGETARAASWGLNGYARQTTPQLTALPVINFPQVTSCGTNTEVSLPCMFAPVGRRDYDEARIRGSESLLHVLARAGVAVHWRDNQSGCKGVCDGLPHDNVQALNATGLCSAGQCLDEGLLHGLERRLAAAEGAQLLVLHQLGNHGPAYFRRYPPPFARFMPACNNDDLSLCTRQEIVNAYDNALLYTDHVLAQLITQLAAHAEHVDSALIYVSDHGESLGEGGLFLHGMPYAIAPDVQTHVPMMMWLSAGAPSSLGLDTACLRRQARTALTHDNLFHTLLGVFDVRTRLYEAGLDFGARCRGVDAALS
ncbi:MAG: phosphoethanolamine--lipid A transferase [Burkholderiaceae bacterium]|nr:phosphoethanolamine--lipid A transferase [Burkholderiaceae bacterium]